MGNGGGQGGLSRGDQVNNPAWDSTHRVRDNKQWQSKHRANGGNKTLDRVQATAQDTTQDRGQGIGEGRGRHKAETSVVHVPNTVPADSRWPWEYNPVDIKPLEHGVQENTQADKPTSHPQQPQTTVGRDIGALEKGSEPQPQSRVRQDRGSEPHTLIEPGVRTVPNPYPPPPPERALTPPERSLSPHLRTCVQETRTELLTRWFGTQSADNIAPDTEPDVTMETDNKLYSASDGIVITRDIPLASHEPKLTSYAVTSHDPKVTSHDPKLTSRRALEKYQPSLLTGPKPQNRKGKPRPGPRKVGGAEGVLEGWDAPPGGQGGTVREQTLVRYTERERGVQHTQVDTGYYDNALDGDVQETDSVVSESAIGSPKPQHSYHGNTANHDLGQHNANNDTVPTPQVSHPQQTAQNAPTPPLQPPPQPQPPDSPQSQSKPVSSTQHPRPPSGVDRECTTVSLKYTHVRAPQEMAGPMSPSYTPVAPPNNTPTPPGVGPAVAPPGHTPVIAPPVARKVTNITRFDRPIDMQMYESHPHFFTDLASWQQTDYLANRASQYEQDVIIKPMSDVTRRIITCYLTDVNDHQHIEEMVS